ASPTGCEHQVDAVLVGPETQFRPDERLLVRHYLVVDLYEGSCLEYLTDRLSAAVLALPRRDGVGDGQDRGPNHGGTLLIPGSGPQEPCHTRARFVAAVKRERGNLACLLGRTATKGPASSGGIETLKIHEYQAKELLAPFGVAVPLGRS